MADPEFAYTATHTTPQRWLSIVGIGEDGVDGLSQTARRLINDAEMVVGGVRHLALAASLIQGEKLTWPSPIADAFPAILSKRGRHVVVLATGDPFHYGIGTHLAALVPKDEILSLPQPSAFSLAANRLGWSLQDSVTITLHGRSTGGLIRHLHHGARILALSWDGNTPGDVVTILKARGLSNSLVTVLEALGGTRERIRDAIAASADFSHVDPLNTIAIEVVAEANAIPPTLTSGLDDALFENDGQLTKRDVRAVVLSSLAPRNGDVLWDVGLGSGSVAIEWLLCHPSLTAIGIEEQPERAARASRNATTLGATGLRIVPGTAPAAFADLPPPDAIFIGGGASDDGVIQSAWARLKPGGRIVANAVTLESEARLLTAFQNFGGDLTRIAIARADRVGSMHGWRSAMPITHWRAIKS